MVKVTLDEKSTTRLRELTQTVELCDRSGRVVGRFHPELHVSKDEWWRPPASEEAV